jgi:hypothetical protein
MQRIMGGRGWWAFALTLKPRTKLKDLKAFQPPPPHPFANHRQGLKSAHRNKSGRGGTMRVRGGEPECVSVRGWGLSPNQWQLIKGLQVIRPVKP